MSIGAIPTGWDDERCAYAATFVPRPSGLRLEPALVALALGSLGILAGTLYVAAGSPARRIRSLASAVRAAAEGRYQATVRVDGRDEIADLSNAFNEASAVVRSHVDQVERRERTLRDFVAHTHHDVGLPLTVLSGHLASLRDGAEAGETPPPAIIAAAIQEAQYIASLLHNLGAVAQLEAEPGLPRASEVDLRRLVERVALRHQDVARSASIELNHAVPEEPVIVFGDLTLLEQAVNNLVHNAIRYNRAGGHVAVSLDASDGKFALTVEDDGPGVAPETLTRLGEPRFRSEEARSRRPEGSGLGLSIARDVTARHGFELSLASPQGGGFVARVLGKSGGELRRA
jgi:signal transduction histidine kinase